MKKLKYKNPFYFLFLLVIFCLQTCYIGITNENVMEAGDGYREIGTAFLTKFVACEAEGNNYSSRENPNWNDIVLLIRCNEEIGYRNRGAYLWRSDVRRCLNFINFLSCPRPEESGFGRWAIIVQRLCNLKSVHFLNTKSPGAGAYSIGKPELDPLTTGCL